MDAGKRMVGAGSEAVVFHSLRGISGDIRAIFVTETKLVLGFGVAGVGSGPESHKGVTHGDRGERSRIERSGHADSRGKQSFGKGKLALMGIREVHNSKRNRIKVDLR
jgi:hypothetical protein